MVERRRVNFQDHKNLPKLWYGDFIQYGLIKDQKNQKESSYSLDSWCEYIGLS